MYRHLAYHLNHGCLLSSTYDIVHRPTTVWPRFIAFSTEISQISSSFMSELSLSPFYTMARIIRR